MAGTESCSRSCSSLSDREPGRASAPSAIRPVVAYDGCSADDLAARLGVPGVAMFDDVGSTLDVAHALAADGAPAGTVVLADAQSAGRGRHGRRWRSERGAGIWLTILERPSESKALEVLSLRIGLAAARALDLLAGEPVLLKWPNDLYLRAGKLGGVLIEVRWRDDAAEWVAIGLGVNIIVPTGERAAALRPGTSRIEALSRMVPAVRAAARRPGLLSGDELSAFAARDLAVGRECSAPVRGRVLGIDAEGSLLVDVDGDRIATRVGSLVLKEES